MQFIDEIKTDYRSAHISEKLKALLSIASSVKRGGKFVTSSHVEYAKAQGATDMEIHDTVLIAAAFSMFNRYVDGLASYTPTDPAEYAEMGKRMVEKDYQFPQQPKI